MQWQQTMLTRKVGKTLQVYLCWLEVDKRVKEGSIITLKGQKEKWKVEKQFKDLVTSISPETRWGLDLPKSIRTER